jgi:hypothetical protein
LKAKMNAPSDEERFYQIQEKLQNEDIGVGRSAHRYRTMKGVGLVFSFVNIIE